MSMYDSVSVLGDLERICRDMGVECGIENGDFVVRYMFEGGVYSLMSYKLLCGGKYVDISLYEFLNSLNNIEREIRQKIVSMNVGMPEEVRYVSDVDGNEWGEDVYVSVYVVNRFFGGVEEGGWWYNNVSLKKSVPTFGEEGVLRKLCQKMKDWAVDNDLKWGDINSVNGGQDCFIVIERECGSYEENGGGDWD